MGADFSTSGLPGGTELVDDLLPGGEIAHGVVGEIEAGDRGHLHRFAFHRATPRLLPLDVLPLAFCDHSIETSLTLGQTEIGGVLGDQPGLDDQGGVLQRDGGQRAQVLGGGQR